MKTRALLRAGLIVALTAIPVAMDAAEALLPWHPWATFGFSADPVGRITGASSVALDGRNIRLPLTSGKTVTLVAHPHPRTLVDNITDVVACLAAIFFILLAATLVLIGPSPATWAFYVFSFSTSQAGTLYAEYLAFEVPFAFKMFQTLAGAASAAALFSFALRFPDVRLSGVALAAERIVVFGIAPILAAVGISVGILFVRGDIPAATATVPISNGLFYTLFAAAIFVLLARYVTVAPKSATGCAGWLQQ